MRSVLGLIMAWGLLGAIARAADWPTWRGDAARSGSSGEELPAALHEQWSLELPPTLLAWPNEPRLQFDACYAPVVAGNTLFVGSPNDGSLRAYDLATGMPGWCFFTEGPVRFAPIVAGGRVYAGSDDGWLYALNQADGKLLWKVRGAPADRPDQRQLGNNRLISLWPVRGGPVLADNTLYFAAGIWPTLGVSLLAVDAGTGRVVWRNDTLDYLPEVRLDHNDLHPSGLSPQGYLVVQGDALLVPNGRSLPAVIDRATGKLRHYIQGYRNGDCRVVASGKYALVGQNGVLDITTGREVGSRWAAAGADAPQKFEGRKFHLFEGPIHPYKMIAGCSARSVFDGETAYDLAGGALVAYDLGRAAISEYDSKYQDLILKPWRWDPPLVAKQALRDGPKTGVQAALLRAGARLYAHGAGRLWALELPRSSAADAANDKTQAQVAWSLPLAGTPGELVAAHGRLVAVTQEGRLTCFGAAAAAPAARSAAATPQRATPASRVEPILAAAQVTDGYCVVLGLSDAGLVEELIRASQLRVIAVDRNRATVDGLRQRLVAAGLYPGRGEVFCGDPREFRFPPYLASLLLCQRPEELGFSAERSLPAWFEVLRPYGGTLCLAWPAERDAALRESIATHQLAGARLERCEGLAVVRREGALPGAAQWTHECGDAARSYFSHDRRVRPPLNVLWYGDGPDYGFWKEKDYGTGVKPQVVDGRLYALRITNSTLGCCDIYTGRLLWQTKVDPFTRYASRADGIYVAGASRCTVYDPSDGRRRAEYPIEPEPGQPALAADIRVDDAVIVVATAPTKSRAIEKGLWDSTHLTVLDRATGRVLWTQKAQERFNNHALALGGGMVFAVDSRSGAAVDKDRRTGTPPAETVSTITAFDQRSGVVRWTAQTTNRFRTFNADNWLALRNNDDWLAYAATAGILLAGKHNQTHAYNAADGREVWQQSIGGQPMILQGDTFLAQWGATFDVRTGKPVGTPLKFPKGGCNYAVANEFCLFVRDRSASFIDLETRRKQDVYAVRSGCSNSLIAAGGLLSVPNFAVGCVCNYPVQTTFAMLHMPEAAAWHDETRPPDARP